MLDFCGKHNIVSAIEIISMQSINEAYARMLKSDVKCGLFANGLIIVKFEWFGTV